MLAPMSARAALHVVIVEGLAGEPQYAQQFDAQAHAFAQAAGSLAAPEDIRVLTGAAATRAAMLSYFNALRSRLQPSDRLTLYLVGHGSFDGTEYKFNIPGPDLSARDLSQMLDALPATQQLVVATGSASGALLDVLKKPGRVLLTATRSGNEKNATRFGTELAAALASAAADTNKNGVISVQEAYAFANRRVQDYFEHEALLASEHPTLQGDTADRFSMSSLQPAAVAENANAADSPLQRQRADLNAKIEQLRLRKDQLPATQYQSDLEQLLLQLAEVQQRIDASTGGGSAP